SCRTLQTRGVRARPPSPRYDAGPVTCAARWRVGAGSSWSPAGPPTTPPSTHATWWRPTSAFPPSSRRSMVEPPAGPPAALAAPSVAPHYRARLDLTDTLVVSLSQSGRTEEIVEGQRWAATLGAAAVGISEHES